MSGMNWKNLEKMLCPYCDQALIERPDLSIVKCTKCYFRMEEVRFRSMLKGSLKWENILHEKCPVDNYLLQPSTEGKYAIIKCSNAECSFKITEEKLELVIDDLRRKAEALEY